MPGTLQIYANEWFDSSKEAPARRWEALGFRALSAERLVRRPYKPPNSSALCAGNGLHLASLTVERTQFRGAALTGEIGAISKRVGATAAAVIYLDWATRPHVMPVPQMECPCERPRAGGQAGRQSWLTLNPALVVRAPTLAAQSGQNKQIKFWFLVFVFFVIPSRQRSWRFIHFTGGPLKSLQHQGPDSRGSPEVSG